MLVSHNHVSGGQYAWPNGRLVPTWAKTFLLGPPKLPANNSFNQDGRAHIFPMSFEEESILFVAHVDANLGAKRNSMSQCGQWKLFSAPRKCNSARRTLVSSAASSATVPRFQTGGVFRMPHFASGVCPCGFEKDVNFYWGLLFAQVAVVGPVGFPFQPERPKTFTCLDLPGP